MPTPVSDKVRDKVAKAIVAGALTPAQIAEDNGVSESFVSKMKKKLGTPVQAAAPQHVRASRPRATVGSAGPAPAPRNPRTRGPSVPSANKLFAVLEASALPMLQAEEERLNVNITELGSRRERVRALIRLHTSLDHGVPVEPDPRQPGLFENGQDEGDGFEAPASGEHFRNATT